MIELATIHDLDEIDQLAVLVINDMKASNIPQWKLTYPRKEHFEKDVAHNALYLYKEDHRILGCLVLLPENDPPYRTISSWIKDHSMVIHRVLVHPETRNKGIAHQLFEHAEEVAKQFGFESIKIDTHLENYKMRSFLQKRQYVEGDYIEVMDRIAYEKVLEGNE